MKLSPTRLQAMRLAYGVVRDIPHGSPEHMRILQMLNSLDREVLSQVAKADIRWLSWAANAIIAGDPTRDFPRVAHVRDNGWGFMPKQPKPNPDAGRF